MLVTRVLADYPYEQILVGGEQIMPLIPVERRTSLLHEQDVFCWMLVGYHPLDTSEQLPVGKRGPGSRLLGAVQDEFCAGTAEERLFCYES